MRTAEWINLIAFAFFTLLAWGLPLRLRRRGEATLIGVIGSVLTLIPVMFEPLLPARLSAVIRDWLPAALLLFIYWQVGRLLEKPNQILQIRLLRLDGRAFAVLKRHGLNPVPAWVLTYLELAYLFCYALVPLGVGVLYAAGLRKRVDDYWTIVQSSTYLCYVVLPFAQTLPPRLLNPQECQAIVNTRLRKLNGWLLDRASITLNTFPSAHVASTMACALALIWLMPAAGILFMWVALSIAAATVLGRYHFAADAIIAIVLAVAVFTVRVIWFV